MTDALARLTCSNDTLARADLALTQTYYALRQAVGSAGQKPLKSEFLTFIIDTRRKCGLPPVEPGRDQSPDPLPPNAAACVAAAYDAQRSAFAGRLSGPASEEAARPPEQNLALQRRLQALGFLPKNSRIDGIFGTETRAALLAWQRSAGRKETGFFSDADAAALGGAQASTPDPLAGLRVKPLAHADFEGKSVTIAYKNLQVSLLPDTSESADVCQSSDDQNKLLFPGLGASSPPPCQIVTVKIDVDGRNVLKTPLALLDSSGNAGGLNIKAAIRRLDSTAASPQVVLSGYTGGAHCCTLTAVATESEDGTWQFVSLGMLDGDAGFDYLDITRNGSTELVDIGGGFLYQFASYAGSFAPTRIQVLRGAKLQDVTRDRQYRSFLLQQLKEMEQETAQAKQREINGYLAAWVAEKALVGQLKEAWAVMLKTYDHGAADGRSICSVDERVWTKGPYGSGLTCPAGQERLVPFPEALALHLVTLGYITPEQSAGLGYDPAKRKAAVEAATVRYEQAVVHGWFVIDREGSCTLARMPESPAALITADRVRGLEDDVTVLEKNDEGKPTVVRVGSPRGQELVSVITFYRGLAKCGALQKKQKEELDKLK